MFLSAGVRRARSRGNLATALVLGILATLCAGCADDPAANGPLSATTGRGGFTGAAPKNAANWSETFGAFLLCSKAPDTEIHIQDVRFDVSPDPVSIETLFRKIPPASQRGGGKGSGSWMPIASARGVPPFGGRYAGEYVKDLDEPITRTCKEQRKQGSALTELLTIMTVGERGAIIRRTYVDYTVGDENYTLTIRWQNGMCGTAIKGRGCDR